MKMPIARGPMTLAEIRAVTVGGATKQQKDKARRASQRALRPPCGHCVRLRKRVLLRAYRHAPP